MEMDATASAADCLGWYALNSLCEHTGHVWIQDNSRRWKGPSPLFVEAEHEGKRYVSGRYGRLERRAAWCLAQMVNRDVTAIAYDPPRSAPVDLGDSQIEALRRSCGEPVSIITGGPGTGKTTIAGLLARAHNRVIGLSPTGKGADRLADSIGHSCYTVHRMDRLIRSGEIDLSGFDLIECDETGMLDTHTLEMLCAHLYNSKTWARIVFLGDPGQLPSIGPGKVLDELISALPMSKLDIVYRYSDSDIGTACEYAGLGRLYQNQRAFYSFSSGGIDRAIVQYQDMAEIYGTTESRLITHRRQDAATFNDNMKHVHKINPPIVCIKNNYQHNVFNGQCGYAERVSGGRIVFGNKVLNRFDVQWAYAYGSTCHKAQGGQWDGVVVWLPSARYVTREWLKTACSRAAKNLSIVVRDADTTERCLTAAKPASRRVSLLSGFLSGKAQWMQ